MMSFMNKEKTVFVLALLLFVWGGKSLLDQEKLSGTLPSGKKLAREDSGFLSPDIRLQDADRLYREGCKDVFAEPVDLKPLEPLDLDPPPLALVPLTAPPPVPGPSPRFWAGLRHPVPPTSRGGGETGGGAPAEGAGTEQSSGTTKKKEEPEKIDPATVYDSVLKKGGASLIFGRIRNKEPLSLVEMERDDVENHLILKKGARLEFDYYDAKNDRRTGTETFDSDQLEFFSLAGTHENLYSLKLWRLPEGDVLGRIKLARWLAEVGKVKWAAEEYREALRMDPRNKEICLELGQTLEREHLWEEALACYSLARKQGLEAPQILYREGRLLQKFWILNRAADVFRRVLVLDRGDTRARLALGECLTDLGQLEEAITLLKQAQGASAPTGTPLMNALWVDTSVALSKALLRIGNIPEALRCLRAVADEDKDRNYKRAWQGLGAALFTSGKQDDLIEALEAWTSGETSEISRVTLINRGYAFARLGRYSEARVALKSALQDDPLHADLAHIGLAFVDECEGKVDDALEHYENAILQNPLASYPNLAIGRIQRRQGDLDAARDRFKKVLDRFPGAVDVLVEMAASALAARQPALAIRYLERALEIEPKSLDIQTRLGAALLRANREQQAMEVFEAVLAKRDDDPAAMANMAVVHYRRGDHAKAIGHLQTVVEAGRNNPTVVKLVEYARKTAAAIDDNARKRLWEDDFNRTEIKNDWVLERSHGVSIRIVKGKVHFKGQQKSANEQETGMLRTLSLGQLVTFDAALDVAPGTKANIGIEVVVRHARSRRGGDVRIRGALQFVRTNKGGLAYRIFDDGEYKPWKILGRAWPGNGTVRMGFERTGGTGTRWNLTLNGMVIERGIEVKRLRSWNRDGMIGVFGSSKIGVEWGAEVDDTRMILRMKK